jgi:hypothetical protein
MKKFFLILLVAALVGSFAFAEVMGAEAPTLSGSVTTTFGYDLDTETSGFHDSVSVNVTVPLASGGDTKAGMGDVYGEITITDAVISIDEDDGVFLADDLDVTAKIVAGNVWVGLNNPSFKINMVDQADDTDVNLIDLLNDGISVGYMTDAFSVSFLIASGNDGYLDDSDDYDDTAAAGSTWTDSTDEDDGTGNYTNNADNDYAFGATASIMAGPATVDLKFGYLADMYMGFGAKAVVVAGPATVTVPFDYIVNDATSENGMEVNPSVAMAIDGVGSISANLFYAMYDIATFVETEVNAGLTFTEGFNDMLVMTAKVAVTDITAEAGDMGWDVDVDTKYDMGGVAPYVNFGYGDDEVFDLSVGAVFATMIDMATVTLDYTNEDLTSAASEKGRVTLAVKVAY